MPAKSHADLHFYLQTTGGPYRQEKGIYFLSNRITRVIF
jgi:hypothetical protein